MRWLRNLISSEWFFRAIIFLFILETAWVILTLAYPGIFDESWHYLIIKEHANQWWPIITSQSPDTYHLGNITYDPSFLFHYLMSIPYRILIMLSVDETLSIIVLRMINLSFVVGSLLVFRRVFLAIGAGRGISHLVLLFYIAIPIVPFLSAQINNDNLVILFVALSIYFLVGWRESVRGNTPSLTYFLLASTSALFGAMSQYVFLPLLAFVGIVIAWDLIKLWRAKTSLRFASLRSRWGILACIGFILASGLFISSYGVNLVRYHSPIPSCDKILTTEQCLSYYTFKRNYTAEQTNPPVDPNPIAYTAGWLYRLYTTSFYTVLNGQSAPLQVPPFPLPALTAGILLLLSAVLFVIYFAPLNRTYPSLLLVLGSALFFTAILWLHNYQDFLHLKAKVGINGRYLLLVTPFIMIAGALSYQRLLAKRPKTAIVLLVISLLLFFHGGGILTYVIASDATWWWPSPIVQSIAQFVHDILSPVVIRFPLFW